MQEGGTPGRRACTAPCTGTGVVAALGQVAAAADVHSRRAAARGRSFRGRRPPRAHVPRDARPRRRSTDALAIADSLTEPGVRPSTPRAEASPRGVLSACFPGERAPAAHASASGTAGTAQAKRQEGGASGPEQLPPSRAGGVARLLRVFPARGGRALAARGLPPADRSGAVDRARPRRRRIFLERIARGRALGPRWLPRRARYGYALTLCPDSDSSRSSREAARS